MEGNHKMTSNELHKTVEEIAKASIVLDCVMNNDEVDIYEEPCKADIRKYNNYLKALEILFDLKAKGKCDFEAANINEQYVLHIIYVTWVTDGYWGISITDSNRTEIKELLDCFDECNIREEEGNVWQLVSKIFVPTREIEGGDSE
jgi:hypothetical protein